MGKTLVPTDIVEDFLLKHFSKSISNLIPLTPGELACPFSFRVGNEEYVIRIHTEIKSFLKDKYAYQHFHSEKLLIPEVLEVGKMDEEYFFAITRKLSGVTLDLLSKEETHRALPSVILALEEIHKIDVSNTRNYGYWNGQGIACDKTWKEHVFSVHKDIDNWLQKYKRPFLSKDVFEKIYGGILELSTICPEERYLVHGDYGFNNLLIEGDRVSGVLDWGESRYGDFVYDIAYSHFYEERFSYAETFKKHYADTHREVQNFDERLSCYLLQIGYGSIKAFVEFGQDENASWAKDKTLLLLQKT